MARLEVTNLSASYGTTEVLHHLEFSLSPGCFVTLLGPNGSGKSTLFKCLYKELKPTEGKITIDGSDIALLTQKELAKKVSLVPQRGTLEPGFTVTEAVEMGGYANSTLSTEEAITRCHLSSLAEKDVSTLSGGEAQRTLIARSLHQGTQLLLLDEPTSNLDIASALSMLHLFKELTTEGVTIFCSLHDVLLAQEVSDEVLLLKDGVLQGHAKSISEDALTHLFDAPLEAVSVTSIGKSLFIPRWGKGGEA